MPAMFYMELTTSENEKGKPNLLDMGSLMIKPIQRVMKYPLLLCELLNSTPSCHPDYRTLQEAFTAIKDINGNINELKRRKDLVLKYRRVDEEESLKDKLSKLSIHSITKKSKRVTSHLKILTAPAAPRIVPPGTDRPPRTPPLPTPLPPWLKIVPSKFR
ncbi:unnamed protein product [Ranitomeya imitator]|uniref:DH domain-containing protein n=1 Tax=Ranitomeya imitator TaxID=111125 RepID=A0ABN9L5M9_9NEOB|nr:unnamed protein product [Ranitomeya imitator]